MATVFHPEKNRINAVAIVTVSLLYVLYNQQTIVGRTYNYIVGFCTDLRERGPTLCEGIRCYRDK